MNDNKKKPNISRDEKARRKAKVDEDMKHPLNRFMNEFDKEGKVKYPIAKKLRDYFLLNPDPILNGMRMANSLLHELRFHKENAKKYLQFEVMPDKPIDVFNKYGKPMNHAECHLSYIEEVQMNYIVLSKLRDHLVQGLLPYVDNDIFTFEQYNEYVLKVEKIVNDMGYELFPEKICLIEPL